MYHCIFLSSSFVVHRQFVCLVACVGFSSCGRATKCDQYFVFILDGGQ